MATQQAYVFHILILFPTIFALRAAAATTDPPDVLALQDQYRALNNPPQLKRWRLDGGDPCGESWQGVICSGPSVIRLLQGLNLSGFLGSQFHLLHGLRQMDLSYNNITGEIPYSLPPNVTHLDLSYNNFTGDLPSSLASLKNISRLNIQSNYFNGTIPSKFQTIPNLWMDGNQFHLAPGYPPWSFPMENSTTVTKNFSTRPSSESSAIVESHPAAIVENHPTTLNVVKHRKRLLSLGGVVFVVGGVTLVVTGAAIFIAMHLNRSDHPAADTMNENAASTPTFIDPTHTPISRRLRSRNRRFSGGKSLGRNNRAPASARVYTVAELQYATNSFSEDHLLGEGSLGSVYRAEFPDGQVLAVKTINTVPMSFDEEELLMEVIWTVSRLRHPNLVALLGYCVEHGQHLLVYEHVRSLPLDELLHSQRYKPLPWTARLNIALGVARLLEYLHCTFSPPVAHGNVKAANVLFDEDLIPRVCDSGLAILRTLTCNSVKVKAAEMALEETGYIAPEHGEPGNDSTKGDVFAFGVLLLELLTGRKPFDGLRPRKEQYLVKWASRRLHDSEGLVQMVDPCINRRSLSLKSLSGFADIVSLCTQAEMIFRPSMSEIADLLSHLVQKCRIAADGESDDPFDRSFRSTITGFPSSPTVSYYSP
uniref:Leucine-rich repeat receptor-like protein kinase-protein kinase n=1 Tax=Linum usitatissimum TaxID=4006 RepID=A0A165G0L5_LINUS|nr:leucine-rich repeat receptor-like protein kinase-protein kinase [Linum usitatissimum]